MTGLADGLLFVGSHIVYEGDTPAFLGIQLTVVDANGDEVWTQDLAAPDIRGPEANLMTLTLGRGGVLYGSTWGGIFAAATGLRPSADVSYWASTEGAYDNRSNPSRSGSSESAWFAVPPE